MSVKKTTPGAVAPCDSISNQECWDGGSAREGTAEVPQGLLREWGNCSVLTLGPETTQGQKPCASALFNGWTGNPNSD